MAKANPFRFSTKYEDDETDLLYYGYRYYSHSLGRWNSRDRLGEEGGSNLYSFVENEPNGGIDLFGLLVLGWFREGYLVGCPKSTTGASDFFSDKHPTVSSVGRKVGLTVPELRSFPENKTLPADGVELPDNVKIWVVKRPSGDENLLARIAFAEGTVGDPQDKYAIPSVVLNRIAHKKLYPDISPYAQTISEVIYQKVQGAAQFHAVGGTQWSLSESPEKLPRIADVKDWNLSVTGAHRAQTEGPMPSLRGATMFQKSRPKPPAGSGWVVNYVINYGLHYYFTVTPKARK